MKRKPHMSVAFLALVAFALVGALGLSIGLFANNMKRVLTEAAYDRVRASAEQVGDQVTTALSSAADTAAYLEMRLAEGLSRETYAEILKTAEETNGLAGCFLLTPSGQSLCAPLKALSRTTGTPWFKRLSDQQDELAYSLPHVQALRDDAYPWVVSIGKRVALPESWNAGSRGVLFVDVRLSPLMEMCRNALLGESGYLYMVSTDGDVIFHPDQELLNLKLIDENIQSALSAPPNEMYVEKREDGERIILPMTIPNSDWRLVSVANARETNDAYDQLIARLLLIAVVALAAALSLAALFVRRVTSPLRRIEASMSEVERGHLDTALPAQPFSELNALARAFNLMTERVRTLMREAVERQEQLRNAEFSALQAQIKPHFLYNTLDSIIRLLETDRVSDAVRMIESLAQLLRISISRSAPVIPLTDELLHARCYLNIQQIRYKGQFAFSIVCDDDVSGLSCPKLIVQPLVENAIKHGVSEMTNGHIDIRAFAMDGRLCLTVTDNGMGIPPGRLEELRRSFEDAPVEGRTGIGLANIHRRIRLMYGEPYGIIIESEAEVCTTVSVLLPLR